MGPLWSWYEERNPNETLLNDENLSGKEKFDKIVLEEKQLLIDEIVGKLWIESHAVTIAEYLRWNSGIKRKELCRLLSDGTDYSPKNMKPYVKALESVTNAEVEPVSAQRKETTYRKGMWMWKTFKVKIHVENMDASSLQNNQLLIWDIRYQLRYITNLRIVTNENYEAINNQRALLTYDLEVKFKEYLAWTNELNIAIGKSELELKALRARLDENQLANHEKSISKEVYRIFVQMYTTQGDWPSDEQLFQAVKAYANNLISSNSWIEVSQDQIDYFSLYAKTQLQQRIANYKEETSWSVDRISEDDIYNSFTTMRTTLAEKGLTPKTEEEWDALFKENRWLEIAQEYGLEYERNIIRLINEVTVDGKREGLKFLKMLTDSVVEAEFEPTENITSPDYISTEMW